MFLIKFHYEYGAVVASRYSVYSLCTWYKVVGLHGVCASREGMYSVRGITWWASTVYALTKWVGAFDLVAR